MIECENLVKIYKTKDIEVMALQGLDLIVEEGEFMAMIGKSGSGKSTLMNLLGGLDSPTAGKLTVDGIDMTKMTRKSLIGYKRKTVGFVWQNNARNMLPYLSAEENIMLPMNFSGTRKKREKARELLEMVGLSARRKNRLDQLSGGEQQRVAIAIALANDPRLLLADEPTGAVDTKTSDMIFDLFRELNRTTGLTIVTVTHDRRLSGKVDRVVNIRDGKTSSEFIRNISYARELEALQHAADVERSERTHTEMLVLDRAGRLQLPAEYISELKLSVPGRVLADIENERIVLKKEKENGKTDE
ncbi:MAG: ABC transporter ATP-binding protein [Ruminococcaceae bacterium]|nr:ABC transporter ATP-binding protein [Oscillospiraceae bacterium]